MGIHGVDAETSLAPLSNMKFLAEEVRNADRILNF